MRIFYLIVLLLTLLLNSCSTTTTTITPSSPAAQNETVTWESRAKTLAAIKSWDVNGMIAVRAQHDSGSGTMRWQQQQQNYSIMMYGPLGLGSFKLRGHPGQVQLEVSEGKTFNATSPEAILLQQTGWNIPVSNLYYWIRGLPVPGVSAEKQFDAYNHIVRLHQSGWVVEYSQYTSAGHIDLPKKINIQNAQVSVKVFIKQWKLGESAL